MFQGKRRYFYVLPFEDRYIWGATAGMLVNLFEVLTGQTAGERGPEGNYPPETVFGKVDAELTRLAEEVSRYGAADGIRPD